MRAYPGTAYDWWLDRLASGTDDDDQFIATAIDILEET